MDKEKIVQLPFIIPLFKKQGDNTTGVENIFRHNLHHFLINYYYMCIWMGVVILR